MAWLEFKFAYYNVAVQHINYFIKTLHLGHWSKPHISDAKLTSLCVAWTGGPGVELWPLHPVVVGSISSSRDHGMHCWWDLIRLKQLFHVLYVARKCLPDFLVMVIPINIRSIPLFKIYKIYVYIYIYI